MGKHKIDIGLVWAKYVNTWGQVGAVVGTVNFLMMLGVFYTTTVQGNNIPIPLWAYIAFVVVGTAVGITFVLKIGISGYYRFFSKTSELSETNKRVQETDRKLGLIMDKLEIGDNGEGDCSK